MVVLNNMDTIKLCDTSISDDLKNYHDEIVEIYGKLNDADYVHFNIPIGDAAIDKYTNTIADVGKIDIDGFDLSDLNSEIAFTEIFTSLINTLKYYKGISDVYDKTDFVISDNIDLESINQDNDAVYGIYISSKEKYLLNKAINKLNAKIVEMDKLRIRYKKVMVMI